MQNQVGPLTEEGLGKAPRPALPALSRLHPPASVVHAAAMSFGVPQTTPIVPNMAQYGAMPGWGAPAHFSSSVQVQASPLSPATDPYTAAYPPNASHPGGAAPPGTLPQPMAFGPAGAPAPMVTGAAPAGVQDLQGPRQDPVEEVSMERLQALAGFGGVADPIILERLQQLAGISSGAGGPSGAAANDAANTAATATASASINPFGTATAAATAAAAINGPFGTVTDAAATVDAVDTATATAAAAAAINPFATATAVVANGPFGTGQEGQGKGEDELKSSSE